MNMVTHLVLLPSAEDRFQSSVLGASTLVLNLDFLDGAAHHWRRSAPNPSFRAQRGISA